MPGPATRSFTATTIQNLRSTVTGRRPANTRQYGEIYVNLADKQIGMLDPSATPQDLVGVRFFSTTATYAPGDFVVQAGALYRCIAAVTTPGAFAPASWTSMAATNALGSMAFQNANAVAVTGGTINSTVIGQGGASTASFTQATVVGAGAGFLAYDRTGSSGQTMLYRSGGSAALWMSESGNALTWDTNLNVTTAKNLTVGGGTFYCYALGQYGANFYAPSGYPMIVHSANGTNAAINCQVDGTRSWYIGAFSDGAFNIYDASGGVDRMNINPGSGTVSFYGRVVNQMAGGYGDIYPTGVTVASTIPGVCNFAFAGATTNAVGGYGTIWNRMDRTDGYFDYFAYGGAWVGSITYNGNGSISYNTTSDGRLKRNIRPLEADIDVGQLIDDVEPVAFEWEHLPDHPTCHGFVAQDLFKVAPFAVTPDFGDSERHWQSDASKLIPYMIAEMQAMRKRIAELEAKS
jgi:hypothetical protein